MIPPLVALIASAASPLQQKQALAIVQQRLEQRNVTNPPGIPGPVHLSNFAITRLVPQGPGLPVVGELLHLLSDDHLIPNARSQSAVANVRAGLYLIHDFLEQAHELAQAGHESDPDTPSAYWHAIMHRREPDYSNAAYWFRRVGPHPAFATIGHDVSQLRDDHSFWSRLRCDQVLDSRGHWDAMAFVDLCQQCGSDWTDRAQAAACLQEIEMRRLLEHACRVASRGS